MRPIHLIRIILCSAAILLQSCVHEQHSGKADVLYFILLDRFVDGDPSNNTGSDPESYKPYDGSDLSALKHYQGGDLKGVTSRLDELDDLGVTMLWLSPFIDNSNTDYVGWWPYHGYHPIDFYAVDEHFGTLKDLQELVEKAHGLGMKVIFDMPFNQTAADHPWIDDPSKKDWYHWDEEGNPHDITDWFDQEQIEIGELHGLPDLAQENPEVFKYLLDVSRFWIEKTGVDGFRLDAVKHVPEQFWIDYVKEIKALVGEDFLLFGEVFWGEAERIAPYTDNGFDYLFDIPGYYAIRNTFNSGASFDDLSGFYGRNRELLGGSPMATLIDNHDVARFNVGLDDLAWPKQRLALSWLFTAPGLPVIYSGTEIGMQGYPIENEEGENQDFLNRRPFPLDLSEEQRGRWEEFRTLAKLRHAYAALGRGDFHEFYKEHSIYGYLRSHGSETLLVMLNNAGTEEFIAVEPPQRVVLESLDLLYGPGVYRGELGQHMFRLPANSATIWSFKGSLGPDLPVTVELTDRYTRDYQQIRLFYVDPGGEHETLGVAGDFNNWQPRSPGLTRTEEGLYITLHLKPGTYQYKLVLDETHWIPDPLANASSVDPYGGRNSVLEVLLPGE